MTQVTRLLIVGFGEVFHMGAHLLQAAQQLGIDAQLLDARAAYQAPRLLAQLNWRTRGHRPTRLDAFSQQLVERCAVFQPQVVLVTGITPPNAETLAILKAQGIRCVNYLTDDPWNRQHHAPWFLDALPHYTHIFSPRTSNLADLAHAGCTASYVPFAYNPALHFYEAPPPESAEHYQCDVLFYGGADPDRLPAIEALIDAGFQVHLYGGYWEHTAKTRSAHRGMADAQTLRWAVASAKITLCLVRRANRDGHVMRSFEAPAMGACLLTEDTEEHRELFSDTVPYFDSVETLVNQTRWLLNHSEMRAEYAQRTMQRIVSSSHTYRDRLHMMLAVTI